MVIGTFPWPILWKITVHWIQRQHIQHTTISRKESKITAVLISFQCSWIYASVSGYLCLLNCFCFVNKFYFLVFFFFFLMYSNLKWHLNKRNQKKCYLLKWNYKHWNVWRTCKFEEINIDQWLISNNIVVNDMLICHEVIEVIIQGEIAEDKSKATQNILVKITYKRMNHSEGKRGLEVDDNHLPTQ